MHTDRPCYDADTRADHNLMFVWPVTGEGQYGKVYTCINVDTGELMAMKEVCDLCRCLKAIIIKHADGIMTVGLFSCFLMVVQYKT